MHDSPRTRTPLEQQRINIVLDYIKAYPERWNQELWHTPNAYPVVNDRGETGNCGTAYCFAGYAQHFFAPHDRPSFSSCSNSPLAPSTLQIAASIYGFGEVEAEYYFNSERTLEELETARWPWFDHEGFGQDGYDRNGYDPDGFNSTGYDAQGYDMQGDNAFGDPRPGAKVADTLDVQPPSLHVVVVGNPRDGIKVVGPFADNDAALRYMGPLDDACYEIQLTPPKE